jgi:hypothetical protein
MDDENNELLRVMKEVLVVAASGCSCAFLFRGGLTITTEPLEKNTVWCFR